LGAGFAAGRDGRDWGAAGGFALEGRWSKMGAEIWPLLTDTSRAEGRGIDIKASRMKAARIVFEKHHGDGDGKYLMGSGAAGNGEDGCWENAGGKPGK